MDQDQEQERDPACQHSQETSTLVAVLKLLTKTDFTHRMGSGLIISITDLAGTQLSSRFMVAAEDMEHIKLPIIDSLQNSLRRRRILRQTEIADIDAALAGHTGK